MIEPDRSSLENGVTALALSTFFLRSTHWAR